MIIQPSIYAKTLVEGTKDDPSTYGMLNIPLRNIGDVLYWLERARRNTVGPMPSYIPSTKIWPYSETLIACHIPRPVHTSFDSTELVGIAFS